MAEKYTFASKFIQIIGLVVHKSYVQYSPKWTRNMILKIQPHVNNGVFENKSYAKYLFPDVPALHFQPNQLKFRSLLEVGPIKFFFF